MSTVNVSVGRARNSSHVQERASSTRPSIEKLHVSRCTRGVGPYESTGKSDSRYWPGGRREGSTAGRRRRKPREMGGMAPPTLRQAARLAENPGVTDRVPAGLRPDGETVRAGADGDARQQLPGPRAQRVDLAVVAARQPQHLAVGGKAAH